MNKKALVVIDYINEIVDAEKGKLSGKGYGTFIAENDTFSKVNKVIHTFEENGDLIVFVRLAFLPSYAEQPKASPIFGKAAEFQILQDGTWSTEISPIIYQPEKSVVITKQRVSSFYATRLEALLRNSGVNEVHLCGVATDLAVEAAARDAHDRDFKVYVLSDACAAANQEDHTNSLTFMSKIAQVI